MTDTELLAYKKGWQAAMATVTANIGEWKPLFFDDDERLRGQFEMANRVQKWITENSFE